MLSVSLIQAADTLLVDLLVAQATGIAPPRSAHTESQFKLYDSAWAYDRYKTGDIVLAILLSVYTVIIEHLAIFLFAIDATLAY